MTQIVSRRWVGNVRVPTYAHRSRPDRRPPAVPRQTRADREAVARAWGDWIAGMGEWHLFGGLTYDQRRRRTDATTGAPVLPGADVAKHHVRQWLEEAPKRLGRPIEAAVVALEYQRNGWPHFHPLLRIAGGLQGNELQELGGAWFEQHGFARLEVPRELQEVCSYASKYLAKDLDRGDVIFWPRAGSLRLHQPGLPGHDAAPARRSPPALARSV